MSDGLHGRARAARWVAIALSATALLVAAGVLGVPWAIRRDLIANQETCCAIARAFERERPGGEPGGPAEVGACLEAVVESLPPRVRERLADGMVEHDGALRRPFEPLHGPLLDVPLEDATFEAIDRCATARTSRWRGGHGLEVRALLLRATREAHLERDPDRRLRALSRALELWVDAYALFDLGLTEPLLWARELGDAEGSPPVRAEVAERLRALAASLPDIETATATFYCTVYGEVRELALFDAWEANEQFGASLAMGARTEPAPWGREPAESRLDRAIPSGIQHDQFAEPGSAYIAGTLMVAAQQLDPSDERFLGQPVRAVPADEGALTAGPCLELVLPPALDDRELSLCRLDPGVGVAARELAHLFRALRRLALSGGEVPERIDDLARAAEPGALEPATPPCAAEPRSPEALEAWRAVGYEAPTTRRVALTLLTPPALAMGDEIVVHFPDAGWRLLRARWRSECDGPIHEARLFVDGPADDPRPTPLELGEASEPASEPGAQPR